MSNEVTSVSDSGFKAEVLESDLPVLVDFWAEWCQPCRAITPFVEEVAKTYQGRLKVCKINVDENSVTPTQYGVRAIPTLMIVKEGNVVATKVGALSRAQIMSFAEENL